MRCPAKPNRPGGLFSSVIVTLPWLGTWRPCYSCPKTPVKDNNVRTCEIISNCFERFSLNTLPKKITSTVTACHGDNTILLSSSSYVPSCGILITCGGMWLVGMAKQCYPSDMQVFLILWKLEYLWVPWICVKSKKRKEWAIVLSTALLLKTW